MLPLTTLDFTLTLALGQVVRAFKCLSYKTIRTKIHRAVSEISVLEIMPLSLTSNVRAGFDPATSQSAVSHSTSLLSRHDGQMFIIFVQLVL